MSKQLYGINSSSNTNLSLSEVAWNLTSGTVVSTTRSTETSTITIDTGSSVDDTYNNLIIEINNGTGLNHYYLITDYVGSTKTCTISKYVDILPDTTSTYIIHKYSGLCGEQTQSNQFKSVTVSDGLPEFDRFFTNCFIKTIDETVQVRRILSYSSSTNVVSLDSQLGESVYNTTLFIIIGESGQSRLSDSNGSTTLYLEEAHGHNSTDTDYYVGFYVEIYSGTGSGQTRKISAYDETTLICTLDTAWETELDADSNYNIYSGWGAQTFDEVLNYSQSTVAVVSGSGEKNIIYQQLGLTNDNLNNRGKYSENSSLTPSSVHTLVVVSNYYKIKIVSFGTTLNGSVSTIFHNAKNKALTSFIDEQINKNNDCELTRAIITGKTESGKFKNALINNKGSLMIDVAKPLSSFGEVLAAILEPIVQINFSYFKNPNIVVEHLNYSTVVKTITPGSVGVANVQTIYVPSGQAFNTTGSSNYFYIFSTTTTYYVWFNVTDASTSDPSVTGTGIQIDILSTDLSYEVSAKLITILTADAAFTAEISDDTYVDNNNIVKITNVVTGAVTTILRGTMPVDHVSSIGYNKEESSLTVTNEGGIGSYSTILSKREHKFRPGQGGLARFTCIFDEGSIGVQQIAGVGNLVSGFFFGVNPSNGLFSILHRKSGIPSVHSLQITSASTGTQTLTIRLDGVDFQVPIVSGTVEEVAYQICNTDDIYKLGVWHLEQVGDTVLILSDVPNGPRTGVYSLTSDDDVTGSFTVISTGTAVNESWTDIHNWNINKLNGYESNNMHLNYTKGNVYEIQYQAGYGAVIFSIEEHDHGKFIPVHEIKYSNTNIAPNISQSNMHLIWSVDSTTSTDMKTLKVSSGSIFNEGPIRDFDNLFSDARSLEVTTTEERHIVTYKNLEVFKGKKNQSVMKPFVINFSNDSGKTSIIRVYLNSTLTDYNYQYINEELSTIKYDVNSTITGGILIFSMSVSGGSSQPLDNNLLENLSLRPYDSFSFTVQSNTNDIDITSVLTWHEDQ